MTKSTVSKIVLSASRDIPLDKLTLSQANVRRIKADVSIEQLAEDIGRRTLLQSLTVRPVLDEAGQETGLYDVPAGGRRFRALQLLVSQKRLPKTAPIPCVIRTEGIAEEDSLAENVQRAPLHPLDQFRAFFTLREKGQSEEEIAANFFVTTQVVRQRLKLASVSPKLLDVYGEDGMTLDQLMAFTVACDHERQEQVFERLAQSYAKDAHTIRRMLTEGTVRASDKRARFIGLEAYEAEGGTVMRDLFTPDDGGWLQDPSLIDRLVAEKLTAASETVAGEGWRWIEVAPDFPYGHTFGLRQLRGEPSPLTPQQDADRAELQAEYDRLEAEHAKAEELPDEADQRLGELETALAAFEDRPITFDPDELARAGAFVSIDPAGQLRVERGYVRPEDERPIELAPEMGSLPEGGASTDGHPSPANDGGSPAPDAAPDPEEEEGMRPIPDRLMTELTAHRTLALRDAVGERPDVAFTCVLHALALQTFYAYAADSCLQITATSAQFSTQAPGLNDSASARSVEGRHRAWAPKLPKDPAELWDVLESWCEDSRQALFAHCVGQTVNAVHESWNRRPRAMVHADQLAEAVGLDMVKAGWTATADSFLGRVVKARIVQAVREGRGEADAGWLAGLKKEPMVEEAARLLAGSGWLPEPLRTPGQDAVASEGVEEVVESENAGEGVFDGQHLYATAVTDDVEYALEPEPVHIEVMAAE